MPLFGGGKPKVPKRRRVTNKNQPPPSTLKGALEQVLISKALKDSEWGWKEAKRQFGIPEEVDDAIAQQEKEIAKAESELIIDAIRNDPEYREQVKMRRLEAISPSKNGSEPTDIDDDIKSMALDSIRSDPKLMSQLVQKEIAAMLGKRAPGDSLGEAVENLRALREFQGEFGGEERKGGLGGLLTPEVIQTLIQTFAPILIGNVARQQVFTLPDGKQVGAEEYRQYLENAKRPQLAEAPPPPQAPVEAPPQAQEPEPENKPSGSLRLGEWLPYLEKEPLEFVEALLDKLAKGTDEEKQYASFVVTVMKEKDANELLTLLQQFKAADAETKLAIEALETHKDWLVEVIDLIRGSE